MLKRSNLRLFEKAVSFLNIIVISNKHLFEKVVAFPNIIIISKMVELTDYATLYLTSRGLYQNFI